MEIKIWQIQHESDTNGVLFDNTDKLRRKKIPVVDSTPYAVVFAGHVQAETLEDVFIIFNCSFPEHYFSRSLSVSDVVEVVTATQKVEAGFYFCDSLGFKKVLFDPLAAKGKSLRAILIEPNRKPVVAYIPPILKIQQNIVGGYIQSVGKWFRDPVLLCCNEDGKMLQGLLVSRVIHSHGCPTDYLVGTTFLVGKEYDEEGIWHFASIPDNLIDKYMKMFDGFTVELEL